MINEALDVDRLRLDLARRTRVQIRDFLQPDAADTLHGCLANEVPWQLAHRVEGQSRATERGHADREDVIAPAIEHAYEKAREEYQFVYDSYLMVRAAKQGWDPELKLHVVLQFLNTPEFIAFARYLTGDPTIRRASAQATRYRPGQFLMRHEDEDTQEGRRYAYVINLTRRWEADWGGQLQFLSGDGDVVDTFLPRYNSLSLFKVPQPHLVSLIAPWAQEHRYGITGWFLQ